MTTTKKKPDTTKPKQYSYTKPLGRPAKYKTPQDLEQALNKYFDTCDAVEEPYTIPGAAYFLGFTDKTSLWEQGERVDKGFAVAVSCARLRIESQRNIGMLQAKNTRGYEFDLQHNFNWVAKKEVKHTGQIDHMVSNVPPGIEALLPKPAQIEDKSDDVPEAETV